METKEPAQKHAPAYEMRDADIRSLLLFGAGLFLTLVLTLAVVYKLFWFFSKTQSVGPPASPFADTRPLPPAPRLQVQPRMDLQHLRQREDEALNTYGWVDPKARVAHIPIDRAMDLLLKEGLPVRNPEEKQK